MAVLVIATVPDTGAEDRVMWRERNKALPKQPGFLFQGDGPAAAGWLIASAWQSRADYEKFFATQVRPHLPPGADQARVEIHELESVVAR